MTTQQTPAPQAQPAPLGLDQALDLADPDAAFPVHAVEGSRLEQLHAAYADAKAHADEAAKRLKLITDAIKNELNTAAPDSHRVELRGSSGPVLRMSFVESWRLDSTRLKSEHPETWVRYAKKSGSWTLKAVSG